LSGFSTVLKCFSTQLDIINVATKNMTTDYRKQAIKYWERRRIFFNIIILIMFLATWPISRAFTAGSDDKIPAQLSDPIVIIHIAISFLICNIGYSIVYALEFFFYTPESGAFWPSRGRFLIFCAGCFFVVIASGPHFSALEQSLAYFP